MLNKSKYVSWFRDLGVDDVALVGGKNASLGEMYRELTPKGVRVPNGFAITAQAYRDMLTDAGAWEPLHELFDDFDKTDVAELARRGQAAREIVYKAGLSPTVREQVLNAYHTLQEEYGAELSLAVRSSATAEDLPTASFAGQHETFLNVRGDEMLLDACRRCFASIFLDRAISYRVDQGFDHFKVALSVGVMKMVRSDLASSGVIFTPTASARTSCRAPWTPMSSTYSSRRSATDTAACSADCEARNSSRWSTAVPVAARRLATCRR